MKSKVKLFRYILFLFLAMASFARLILTSALFFQMYWLVPEEIADVIWYSIESIEAVTIPLLILTFVKQNKSVEKDVRDIDYPAMSSACLTSFLAFICVISLLSASADMPMSFLIWTLYILVCGFVIRTNRKPTFARVLFLNLSPGITFTGSAISTAAIASFFNSELCVSCTGSSMPSLSGLSVIYSLFGLATMVGITITFFARERMLEVVANLQHLTPEGVNKTRNIISGIVSIATIVGAAILLRL